MGCVAETDADDDYGETSEPVEVPDGENPCEVCSDTSYMCICGGGHEPTNYCWSGAFYIVDGECTDHCDNGGTFTASTWQSACANTGSPSCTGWDPASEVTYYSGPDLYVLDWSFVHGLVADPEPLWGCDDGTTTLEFDCNLSVSL